MKSIYSLLLGIGVSGLLLAGCDKDNKNDGFVVGSDQEQTGGNDNQDNGVASSARNELYRPQVHFTPKKNWINDPNGMVYVDGIYHLYYQYNPQGNGWGNMSWGHATSTDLMHWDEKPVAMVRNQWGDIFSGSAIVDKENVAGFGKNAILAFYTASGEHQQQCLAYSTDGGLTFTQYENNPVIANTSLPDFRDPKVIWHEESGKWIMCLALGWSTQIEFWGSADLKHWEILSTFTTDAARCNIGQWECPDLIRMPYNGGEKWVLIVSNNPGGPVGGSGTEYFVGDFDGKEFKAMNLDYPLWLDYGADNYAGVTWSNAPAGRTLFIGWMNNWNYSGDVPCSPWRSAMTLPRELTLKDVNGSPLLCAPIVKELDGIAGAWRAAVAGEMEKAAAYEAKFAVSLDSNTSIRLANSFGEYMDIEVRPSADMLTVKRGSSTGKTDFHSLFSIPGIQAPLHKDGGEMILHLVLDASSVEIFSEDGRVSVTNLVFPQEPYNRILGVEGVEYRPLSSIW
ncbi:MAG: glycoside hydrolase family 32 protein [Muribaculaceae bacterium]|nr:glycoside hydrolase family 32 protein [Muribaculaceae bacterium]